MLYVSPFVVVADTPLDATDGTFSSKPGTSADSVVGSADVRLVARNAWMAVLIVRSSIWQALA